MISTTSNIPNQTWIDVEITYIDGVHNFKRLDNGTEYTATDSSFNGNDLFFLKGNTSTTLKI